MKKLVSIALILAALLTQTLVGCGNKDDNSDSNDSTPNESTNEVKKDVPVADICKAIEEDLGDEFFAQTEIPEEFFEATYGVKPEWIKESYGKMPMITTHSDLLIAIHANEGNVDDVYKALDDYRNYLANDAFKYPKDEEKYNAAKVYKTGDYVFLIVLGNPDFDLLDDEQKVKEYFEGKNNRAIEIIDEQLGK